MNDTTRIFTNGMMRDSSKSKIRPDLLICTIDNEYIDLFDRILTIRETYMDDIHGTLLKLKTIMQLLLNKEKVMPLISSLIDYLMLAYYESPYDLVNRISDLYAHGAEYYLPRNWERCVDDIHAYIRFSESAFRHFIKFVNNQTDEDHLSATIFNLNGLYYWLSFSDESILLDEGVENVIKGF